MSRFYALMPVRNEAGRYLRSCLEHHAWMFDGIAVFDDQSTDDSRRIAEDCGAEVRVRPRSCASFLEHEGEFRQAAYDWLVEIFKPTEEDWVLALDADEFLVANYSRESAQLIHATRHAEAEGKVSVMLPIPEVFFIDARDKVFVRTDGYWGNLSQPRLFQFRTKGQFKDMKMASGAVPTYAQVNPSDDNYALYLLHYGYARPEDRKAKFDRYSKRPGHANKHVQSIRNRPTLVPWSGKAPYVIHDA